MTEEIRLKIRGQCGHGEEPKEPISVFSVFSTEEHHPRWELTKEQCPICHKQTVEVLVDWYTFMTIRVPEVPKMEIRWRRCTSCKLLLPAYEEVEDETNS